MDKAGQGQMRSHEGSTKNVSHLGRGNASRPQMTRMALKCCPIRPHRCGRNLGQGQGQGQGQMNQVQHTAHCTVTLPVQKDLGCLKSHCHEEILLLYLLLQCLLRTNHPQLPLKCQKISNQGQI